MPTTVGVPVGASREVRAAVLAMKVADSDVRRIIRADTAAQFRGPWVEGVRRRAARGPGGQARSRLASAGVTFSGGNPPEGRAYTSTRRLSGGLGDHGPVEFGATPARKARATTYTTRSRSGRAYPLTRRTTTGLPPYRAREGYAVYPTVADLAPRVVSYWVQSIVRAYAQAADRGAA